MEWAKVLQTQYYIVLRGAMVKRLARLGCGAEGPDLNLGLGRLVNSLSK